MRMGRELGRELGKGLGHVGPSGPLARVFWFGCVLAGGALGWIYCPDVLTWLVVKVTTFEPASETRLESFAPRLALSLLGAIFGGFLATVLTSLSSRLLRKWDGLEGDDKITAAISGFLGLLIASAFVTFLSPLVPNRFTLGLLVIGLGLAAAAFAIYTLQSMSDFLPWSRGKAPGRRTGIKILDTNVIIDGRIYDVARAGFLEGELYVPGFVLEELQYIADSHDALRRQRGKRGLEVLRHLQADFPLLVREHDRHAPEGNDGVDARLVRLARAIGGDLVTNDHNLNRVASLQDVKVLNLNDLALSLRPNVLPQEKMNLTIVREGNQSGQGIGYLDDGTMVVVENGKGHIGETRDVLVTQVIQTERGKLIFAEVEGEPVDSARRRPGPRRTT